MRRPARQPAKQTRPAAQPADPMSLLKAALARKVQDLIESFAPSDGRNRG